jgi:hypothetical protein
MPKPIIPEDLINTLISNNYLLFAGSGLSAGIPRSNGKPLPTWEGLLKELLALTQITDSNYQKITQAVQEK